MTTPEPVHFAVKQPGRNPSSNFLPANFAALHAGPMAAWSDNKSQVTCPVCLGILVDKASAK